MVELAVRDHAQASHDGPGSLIAWDREGYDLRRPQLLEAEREAGPAGFGRDAQPPPRRQEPPPDLEAGTRAREGRLEGDVLEPGEPRERGCASGAPADLDDPERVAEGGIMGTQPCHQGVGGLTVQRCGHVGHRDRIGVELGGRGVIPVSPGPQQQPWGDQAVRDAALSMPFDRAGSVGHSRAGSVGSLRATPGFRAVTHGPTLPG